MTDQAEKTAPSTLSAREQEVFILALSQCLKDSNQFQVSYVL